MLSDTLEEWTTNLLIWTQEVSTGQKGKRSHQRWIPFWDKDAQTSTQLQVKQQREVRVAARSSLTTGRKQAKEDMLYLL